MAVPTFAVTVELPAPATTTREEISPGTVYALPAGPFDGSAVPSQRIEGSILRQSWQTQTPSLSTFDLMSELRAQITAQGFAPIFECADSECGGFDFRYGIETLPEPEMHVDLGDFRFLSATRAEEAVSILVSRSATSGFAQIIHVAPDDLSTALSGSSMSATVPSVPEIADQGGQEPVATTIEQLLERGAAVLSDIDFKSGGFDLAPGIYPSLQEIGAWLRANPEISIALVGHTDASGNLEANVTLSERRAMAVRQRLTDEFDINPSRVEARGVGYLAPRDSNQTEAGRRKNRRVEVIITSTP